MVKKPVRKRKDTCFPDLQELFQAYLEESSDGVFVTNAEGILLEVNEQLCDMLSSGRDEILGCSMSLFLGGEMAQFTQKSNTLYKGKHLSEQGHLRCRNGTLVAVDLRIKTLAGGFFLGVVRDIGVRGRKEDVLYDSVEGFRLLAESSLTGIYLIQDALFRYVNKAFADMFGYEVHEVLNGLTMTDLIYPEDHSLVLENIRRRVTGEEDSIRYVFRGLRKNGSILYVEVHGRRIQFGGKAGVIGTLIDITAAKKAEDDLRHLNEKLEVTVEARTVELKKSYEELKLAHTILLQREKMASVGQLAAGIAHEINTPIQFVSDNITFLRDSLKELLGGLHSCEQLAASVSDTTLIENVQKGLHTIFEDIDLDFLEEEIPLSFESTVDGLKRISNIVVAMKDFAHPSGDKFGPVDLSNLINTSVEISRNNWKQVAELIIEPTPLPLIVEGLRDELGQVVLNLIINAADAIAENPQEGLGRIRVATRILEENWAEIVVEDSGCGIPPELTQKIFEPFFTTKAVGKGSGQGLAISYHIVRDKHGGEIRVDSVPGQGSIFSVRLPISR